MIKNYNKSIMDWDVLPKYDLIWTDPPWEERMVRWFQIKMFKDTGVTANFTLIDIIAKLGDLAAKQKPLIIEYSVKGSDKIVEIMQSKGHTFMAKHDVLQSRAFKNKPFVILVFNVNVYINTNVVGASIITESLAGSDYNVILDLFAGIGFTAKAVKNAGKTYIGSEINKKRYDRLCLVNT